MAGTKQILTRDSKGRFTFEDYIGEKDETPTSHEAVLAKIDRLLKGREKTTDPRKSLRWYRNLIRQFGLTTQSAAAKTFPNAKKPFVGSLFMYGYDPKHKKTLPYYDSFPLVLPLQMTKDGWFGLNFHYLDPIDRAKIFYVLLKIGTDGKLTQRTRIKVTYKFLKSLAVFYMAKPCLKRYLANHVKSKFIRIDPKYWELALFMPVESFKKKSKTAVWGLNIGK